MYRTTTSIDDGDCAEAEAAAAVAAEAAAAAAAATGPMGMPDRGDGGPMSSPPPPSAAADATTCRGRRRRRDDGECGDGCDGEYGPRTTAGWRKEGGGGRGSLLPGHFRGR